MKIKRLTLGLLVATGLLAVTVFAALKQQTQKPATEEKKQVFVAVSIFDGCRHNSFEPEVYSLYGEPPTIRRKLDKFEMGLFDRRVFIFLVESAESAQVVLYERPKGDKDGPFHVLRWGAGRDRAESRQRVAELRQKATDAILANKGYDCIGEIVKKLFEALQPEDAGMRPAPESAVAAVSDVIKPYEGQYIRMTAFLLC